MSSIAATRFARTTARRFNIGSAVAKLASNSTVLTFDGTNTSLTSRLHETSSPAGARFLSTNGRESVGRFMEALEDYRSKNYTQTIPPRFKKEIADVIYRSSSSSTAASEASSVEDQKKNAVEDIERFLENIGALGNKVTHEDVETIVCELGESSSRDEEDIRADLIVTELLK